MNSSTSSFEAARAPATHALPAEGGAGRYLAVAGLVFLGLFAFSWVWSADMKLAFLDPEYAAWSAKQQMLADCDLGDLLILGDSRADAGLIPDALSVRATNVAVGGAKPVELYFFLRRALACAQLPRRVLLSLDAGHFGGTDTFWERSARFGTFSLADLREVRRVAHLTGDESLFTEPVSDAFPAFLRDWLYAHSFPTLQFASMLRGGLFLRYPNNLAERRRTLLARGQHLFGEANRDDSLAEEATLPAFRVLPLEAYFFDRILGELQQRGIAAEFVVMPVNQTTAQRIQPALRQGFAAFLAAEARRHPNFHVLIGPFPSLPDAYFGDYFAHLNARGAALFSRTVDRALHAAAPAASQ